MAVLFAEIGDVRAGRFEDAQPEQAEHGDQGEVVWVGRGPCRGQDGFKLEVRQPQGGRLGWHTRAADVLGGGVLEDGVDDAGAVEADHDRQPPGDGGRLEPADLLQPPHEQFDIDAAARQE